MRRLRGIYAIVDDGFVAPADMAPIASSLAEAGARVVQLRFKRTPARVQWEVACAVRRTLEGWDGLVLANDRADVAACAGLDGVHVGHGDLPPACVRKLPGAGAWTLGWSTHRLAEVRAAAREPVDYVGFGPVFPTTTKPDALPAAGVDALRAACAVGVPVAAIGGITVERLALIRKAGASMAVLLSALYAGSSPAAVVRRAVEVFDGG